MNILKIYFYKGKYGMRKISILNKIRYKLLSPEQKAVFLRDKKILNIGEGSTVLGKVDFGSEPYLITIGENVRITDGVRFITHDGGVHVLRNLYNIPDADKFGQIIVGDNTFIGIKSIIMPGIKVGKNVIIGAGSIVTKDIPDNTVVAGIPARKIKSIEQYYNNSREKLEWTKGMGYYEKKEFLLKKYSGEKND